MFVKNILEWRFVWSAQFNNLHKELIILVSNVWMKQDDLR